MSKAQCSKCGELKTVCCDSGFTVNEDGSYHHISPFCVDCCPNTLTESRRGQIRQLIQRGHLIISLDRLLNAPANYHDVTEHVEEGNVEEDKRNVHSLNNSYSKPRTIYLTPYDMAYALFLGAIAGLCIGALITY